MKNQEILDFLVNLSVPCVRLDGRVLQIPAEKHRYHYIKVKVKVCRHTDGTVSVFHGPRRLARYDSQGQLLQDELPTAT